jgi:alpha-mannosidase
VLNKPFNFLFSNLFLLAASVCPAILDAGPAPNVREVIIVFKTHFDIGYTDLASNVVKRYQTSMIDDAMTVVDQYRALPPDRQFVWTLPGWPLKKIMENWDGQTQQRQGLVLEAFRKGRFAVHALPFTTHTELLEPEDLVRGMGFASQLSRQGGLPLPRDAKMTDVPSHCWILPTLLHYAGVEFLHLGCNAASSSPRVPVLFWWEGPDGSRLLTMYSAAGYGTGLLPPPEWPYRTWLALYNSGDNEGPPKPEDVRKIFEEASRELPGVKVRIGRLSDFADSLLAEKPNIPVLRGDMPDTWIHGPYSDPIGGGLARRVRPLIGTSDTLGLLLKLWGIPADDPRGLVAKAYEQSLLYGEHTWGGSLHWVTEYGEKINWGYGKTWKDDLAAGRFKRLEESWEEHSAYIRKVQDIVAPVLATEIRLLAESVRADKQRIVVFNPLPWKRNGIVQVEHFSVPIEALQPAEGGPVVPVQTEASLVRFVAHDVPAFGYRTYIPVSKRRVEPSSGVDPEANILENQWIKLSIDPAHGAIESFVDKHSGRDLVDHAAPHRFGQFLYERFDASQIAEYVKTYVKIKADWGLAELGKPAMPPVSQDPYRALSSRECSLNIKRTPISVEATLKSTPSTELPFGVTTQIILYNEAPFVDLLVTMHDKPADDWPEAGWISLPFQVDSPQFRLGRAGAIVDPAKDLVPGSNHDLMAANTGVAIFDPQGRGAGICALDSPLVSLDRPGGWKYSPDFIPQKSRVYVNLFNNQWSTNFRLWNGGTWTAQIRIWPIQQYQAAVALVAPGLEARYPFLAAAAIGKPGKLPLAEEGLEISSKGVWVTAFGANPDGPGLVLRLWEHAGATGPCKIRLPSTLRGNLLQPVDLRGRRIGPPLQGSDGRFTVDLKAFAPASFTITPSG